MDLFSSKGIAAEIVSDCGVQFTVELLQQVCESLGIKQIYFSVYHPECNGLVERFNRSIKVMLRKLSQKNPKSWDKWLKFALFAYREIPETSTGFSPFELTNGDNAKNVISYVLEMRKQLSENLELAQETLKSLLRLEIC